MQGIASMRAAVAGLLQRTIMKACPSSVMRSASMGSIQTRFPDCRAVEPKARMKNVASDMRAQISAAAPHAALQ